MYTYSSLTLPDYVPHMIHMVNLPRTAATISLLTISTRNMPYLLALLPIIPLGYFATRLLSASSPASKHCAIGVSS